MPPPAQEEEAAVLVEALLEHDAPSLLVHRLASFNEAVQEEAAAVYNVLAIFENCVEVKPEVAELLFEKTKVRAGRGRAPPRCQASRCSSSGLCLLIQH